MQSTSNFEQMNAKWYSSLHVTWLSVFHPVHFTLQNLTFIQMLFRILVRIFNLQSAVTDKIIVIQLFI